MYKEKSPFPSGRQTTKVLLRELAEEKYKVISFDVFDTLLRRNIMQPEHLFWLMQSEIEQWPGCAPWGHRFVDARRLSSHLAIRQAHLSGREDCGINEIYDVLSTMLPKLRAIRHQVLELELSLESQFLHQYPLGKILFDAAKRYKKKIILTSDMYLPKVFISEILSREGYQGYDLLLVSGDIGATKGGKTLFDWLPLRMNVDRSEILHVGDNETVDYHTPTRRGIKSLLIPKSIELSGDSAAHSAIGRHASLTSVAAAHYLHRQADAKLNGPACSSNNHLDFISYAMLGPLLVGLSYWMASKLRDDSLDRILFLARDGEVVSKAFAILYPELSDKVHYTFASRRMLVYATGQVSANEMLRHYGHMDRSDVSAHALIDAVDGSTVNLGRIREEFSPSQKLGDPGVKERLCSLLDRAMERQFHTNQENLERIRSYYDDCIAGSKRIGLFDIGWRGNLQRSIMTLMQNRNIDFIGLYFGYIFDDQVYKSVLPADTFAFSINFPDEIFNDIIPCLWLLEILFAGSHPSVVDVRKEGDQWLPVYEKVGPATQASTASAERTQRGALSFVQDYRQTYPDGKFANRLMLVNSVRELIQYPSRGDAGAFLDLSWIANIGAIMADKMIDRPTGPSRRAYKKALKNSMWQAGFKAYHGKRPKWYHPFFCNKNKEDHH
ncbi:hypothetical protein ACETRX_35575 [Labrys portucalensis]|uniref:HAD-IA family hydrolase n=1 Tax=Labrys neptuniae TaxID=376174 RepID=A0ABV6ZRY1_9HYPH